MNLAELGVASAALTLEDHDGNDYIKDDGGKGALAVHMSGYYSEAELEMKLAALIEANKLAKAVAA